MDIINPLNRSSDDERSIVCSCTCNVGSADWKVVGSSKSDHCGCQCESREESTSSANNTMAVSNGGEHACHCICNVGSADWKVVGSSKSDHCGCQCESREESLSSANNSAATNYSR